LARSHGRRTEKKKRRRKTHKREESAMKDAEKRKGNKKLQ
jgi:hypothetical protein